MKKYLALVCAIMMCVCCLALAACGGSAASSSSASASASSSSSKAATIEGDWKLAAVEVQGVMAAGDFTSVLGDKTGAALSLKADGTGTMSMQGETTDVKWESSDGKTLSITSTESKDETAITGALDGDVLRLDLSDEKFTGKMIFTADGAYDEAVVIDTASAKPITSADALVGDWKLVGFVMSGLTMYGTADQLASVMGTEIVPTASFTADGKVNLMGSESTYTVDSNGAAVAFGSSTLPVKAIDDKIVVDWGESASGMPSFIFAK